jgi:uncharacterized protein
MDHPDLPAPAAGELRKLRLRERCAAGGVPGQTIGWHSGYRELPRLAQSAARIDEAARFSALLTCLEQRRADGSRRQLVELRVAGSIALVCQRCLEIYDQPLHGESRFELVDTEAEADALFEATEADDDAPEPLVAARPVNGFELMEDELLLSLPIVPRHAVCPDNPATRVLEHQQAPDSPFAALRALKRGG